jgi:hypothetical protein
MTGFRAVFDATFAYRNRKVLAAAAGAALILNVLAAALLTVPMARAAGGVDRQAEEAGQRLLSLEKSIERILAAEDQLSANREGLRYFYSDVLSNKPERMTFYMRELRRMATQSGIKIENISYGTQMLKDAEGVMRFSSTLPVEGIYDAVRRFVSAIENHSDLFLSINRIALRSLATGRFDQIKLDIEVATYFLAEGATAPASSAEGEESPAEAMPEEPEPAPQEEAAPPEPSRREEPKIMERPDLTGGGRP